MHTARGTTHARVCINYNRRVHPPDHTPSTLHRRQPRRGKRIERLSTLVPPRVGAHPAPTHAPRRLRAQAQAASKPRTHLGVQGVEVVNVIVAAKQLVEKEERKLRLDENGLVQRLAKHAAEELRSGAAHTISGRECTAV